MSGPHARVGHRLRERFEITREIGRGGMGVVYAALDHQRGTTVALKVLHDHGTGALALAKLKREFRTLADLRHPNLVRLGELFGGDGPWFFTMEYVEGVDLLSWVEVERALQQGWDRTLEDASPITVRSTGAEAWDEASSPRADALSLDEPGRPSYHEHRLRFALAQLVEALCALHAAGHVHRDLKPSNVLVTPQGRVVLIDFGIARPRMEPSSTGGVVEGTPAYMAPEQWTGDDLGPAIDWYAMGVMLFEALAGALPFDGSLREIVAQKLTGPPHLSASLAEAPPDLARLALRLIDVSPLARPTPDEIREVLASSTRPTSLARADAQRDPRPAFVGRSLELARIRSALERSRAARLEILSVVGESGVGKSALVRRFVEEAQRADPSLTVLAGRCYQNELVPYKAWDSVVDALARHLTRLEQRRPGALAAILPAGAHALTRIFPILASVFPPASPGDESDPRPSVGPERLRRLAFDALRELFAGLVRLGPVVVVVDDWQWADRDSEQLLDHLALGPGAPAFLLVATERPRSDGTSRLGERATTTLSLGPLDARESLELAEALSGGAQPREELEALARESSGHPMFLHQLLHGWVGDRPALRLDDLLLERARALPGDARRALELICVAGTPLPRAVIERAAALTRARCAEVLEALEVEKLVRAASSSEELAPWHDRVREALEGSLSAHERVALHAALAEALAAHEGASHSLHLVRHLQAAGLEARAADAAEQGARRAREALAFERAVELFRLALELGEHTPEHALGLRVELADALSSAGLSAWEAAQGFLAGADATADLDRALELRTRALDQLAISGHVSEALALVARIYTALGAPLPRSRLGLAMGVALQRARLRLQRWPTPEEIDAAEPRAESLASRLYTTTINSITILDPLLVQYIHSRTLAGALRSRDHTTLGLCLSRESGLSVVFGAARLEHAERASQLAHWIFRDDRSVSHRGWLGVGDAIRHHFTGRFERALEHWRDAERVFAEAQRPPFALLSGITIFVLACQRYLGRMSALQRELERARAEAVWREDLYLDVTSTLSSGIGRLLVEGPDAARADLERVDSTTELARWGPNAWYRARALAEIDLHRDAPSDTLRAHARTMQRLSRTASGFVATWRAEMPWLEARLWLACAAQGDLSGLGRAERIARRLLAGSLPYERIWGGLVDAAARAQAGDAVGASAALGRAADVAELHGYALCAAAANRELAMLTGEPAADRGASAYFESEGITDVEAALRVIAPGLRRRRALPRA